MSHRASVNHPWGEAVNLGPGVNTPLFEGSIDISPDQRTAFFAGVTPDFVFDIFVSTAQLYRRAIRRESETAGADQL